MNYPINLLSKEEIDKIEATKLPSLEKHYLRLLAHCLESFRAMNYGAKRGSLPSEELRRKWLLGYKDFKKDEVFINVLLEQLSIAEVNLNKLANDLKISPLALTVDHLIQASLSEN